MLGLAAAWAVLFTLRPYSLGFGPVLIPLAGTVAIGLVQLMTGHTVNRWETWNAVLKWSVYLTAFFLASQICSPAVIRRAFRRALLYFGFGISVVALLTFFTSSGKIFWLFPSEFEEGALGPFVSRDHYAAFIELILPIALFDAMSDRRTTLSGAVMAGAMVASVIAGASRAGSILVVLESAAVLLVASRRGIASARRVSGVFASLLVVCILVFTAVVGWTQLWERFAIQIPTADAGSCSFRRWPWHARGPGRVSALAISKTPTQPTPYLTLAMSLIMRTTTGPSGPPKEVCLSLLVCWQ